MTQFSKLDEYIFQFGQKHFPILMNIFCYSDNIYSSGFLRAMGSSGSLTMAGLCDTRPLGRDKASGGRGRGSGTKQQKCGQPTNQPHDEDATVQHEVSSRQTEAWLTRPLVATRKSFVQDRNLLQLGVSAGFIHPFSAPTTSQSSLAAIFLRCTLRRKKNSFAFGLTLIRIRLAILILMEKKQRLKRQNKQNILS